MHPTLVTITALLLSSFPCIAAIGSLNAPSSVKAGTDFVVSVNPDPEQLASSDTHFTEYRVYLAISPPGDIKWTLEPVCYLINSSAISITEFTVQIPASVGPSGPGFYAIATQEFGARGDDSDITYSDTFSFTGGTGKWTQYELEDDMDNDPDSTPCSAYGCSKQCSQKFYSETRNATTIEDFHNTYSCWLACPGTTYKSWDHLLEQYWKYRNATSPGSDDGGPDTSSSTPKSTSVTKSATTTTKSRSTISALTMSTSTSVPASSTSTSTTTGSTPAPTKSASGNIGVDLFVLMSALSGFAALLYTL
jgi:hypothetical protein